MLSSWKTMQSNFSNNQFPRFCKSSQISEKVLLSDFYKNMGTTQNVSSHSYSMKACLPTSQQPIDTNRSSCKLPQSQTQLNSSNHIYNSEARSLATPEPRPAPKQVATRTVSSLPIRRNVFDDDDFDRLALNPSHLHFGRKDADKTADDILEDKSMAPNKAAILSALAAFDSDDDERDDTYDTAE